jgi:hypothetical protein
MSSYLAIAKQVIRQQEQRLAAGDPERLADRTEGLRGKAVELWRTGDRFFIVADEADARAVVEQGAGRGEVWTGPELEIVAQVKAQSVRDEIERWKRATDSRVSEIQPGKGATR